MDDLFLYNHIRQAIKQRNQFSKDTQEGNFAQKYCRRQLMKKKLNVSNKVSKHSNNKMQSLMKNFAHLDTYIDLNQLLYSINLIRNKQVAQKQMQKLQQKQRISKESKVNQFTHSNNPSQTQFDALKIQPHQSSHIDSYHVLQDKVRNEINQRIRRKYQLENNEVDILIQNLEDQSSLKNSLLKNNSSNYLSYLNQELERIQRDQDLDGGNCPDNFKIFKQLTQKMNQPQFESIDRKQYFKSTNLHSKQKKQENQLLHKISTFLNIALQNQHKQKWATKQMKKFRSTHGSFRLKKTNGQRSKFFLQGVEIEKENKNFLQNLNQSKKIISQQKKIFGINSPKAQENSSKFNFNQDNLNSSNQMKNIQKQSPIKYLDRQNICVYRKTAPVNRQKETQSFIKGLPSKNQVQEMHQNRSKLSEMVSAKRQYKLNKGRMNNFVCPIRKNYQHKTVIVRPSDQKQKMQLNTTCAQLFEHSTQIKTTINKVIPQLSMLHKSIVIGANNKENVAHKSPLFRSQSLPAKGPSLSEIFTFKKRNKKQHILNKLQTFIEDINQEQKMSKLQNEYYDSAINHLHDLSKTAYKNYQPQALAGHEEINQLKKFVNNINPSMRKKYCRTNASKRGAI